MKKAAEAEKEWEQMMAAADDDNVGAEGAKASAEWPIPGTAAYKARDIIAPPPAMPPGLNGTDAEVDEEAVRAYFADEEKRKAEAKAEKEGRSQGQG